MMELSTQDIPASKSLYNRALILKSFEPDLKILCNTQYESEDVQLLKKALNDLSEGKKSFFCGAGAAPLKFLAIRLSREMGTFSIQGTPRLFSRPLGTLLAVLEQVGCSDIECTKDSLTFTSSGLWPEKILVNAAQSGQELSALILSSWDLDKECLLEIQSSEVASLSYIEMTLALMMGAGWSGEIQSKERLESILLPKKQFVVLDEVYVEPDMSCIAALALMGALKEGIAFNSMIPSSLQGDQIVFRILNDMGVKLSGKEQKKDVAQGSVFENLPSLQRLEVFKADSYTGIEVDLISTPDLFPVLAAFSVSAQSPSVFKGLRNLDIKESKRLAKMTELLTQLGVKCEATEDSFKVYSGASLKSEILSFNPDQDHRLAMAAALLKLQGANIHIESPEVVNKSFPNFWDIFSR